MILRDQRINMTACEAALEQRLGDHTLYDIGVQHVLETRGQGARADMDAALRLVADELEAFARKRDRLSTIATTIAFVAFTFFAAHEVSAWVDGQALVAPALANAMLATAAIAAFVAFVASRKRGWLIDLERRGQFLATIRNPALAPLREVLKECVEGGFAVIDRNCVQLDRPIFASPHAVILFLPLQRHRKYRLPKAERPFDEQLQAVRALQPGISKSAAARSGAADRNAFLEGLTTLFCVPRFQKVAEHWDDPTKGVKIKRALMEARELAEATPAWSDTVLAKNVAARFEALGLKIGLSESSSTEWLEQVLGGTGEYGWIRDYLTGDDEALPARRARKRRS